MTNNKQDIIQLAIKFFKFDFDLHEFSTILGLDPTDSFMQGGEYYIGPPHRKIRKNREFNFWEHREVVKGVFSAQELINDFIKRIIHPRSEIIERLSENIEREFFVFQEVYDGCNPGFHFEAIDLGLLSRLNINLDIDTYVLSRPVPDA